MSRTLLFVLNLGAAVLVKNHLRRINSHLDRWRPCLSYDFFSDDLGPSGQQQGLSATQTIGWREKFAPKSAQFYRLGAARGHDYRRGQLNKR